MALSFRAFLRSLAANSKVLRNPTTVGSQRLTLVLGNESADLDSIVSSLTLAYVLSQKTTMAIPVINTNRSDMVLRPDSTQLLQHTLATSGTTIEEALTFIDDINLTELIAKAHPLLDVWLVDHNAPSSRQAQLEPYVTGIVDHHVDEAKCLVGCGSREHRQIEIVGSCATLVAQRLRDLNVDVDSELALLLLAPILVDSSNLDPAACRATTADIECAQWLVSLVDWETNNLAGALDFKSPRELYKALDSLKGAVSHLSAFDLLRKDYKQWQVSSSSSSAAASASANGVVAWTVGISSIGFPLKKWIKRDGVAGIELAIRHWMDVQGLDLALVMTHGKTRVQGVKTYGRQLVVALSPTLCAKNSGRAVVDGLAKSEILGLQPYYDDNIDDSMAVAGDGVYLFSQSRTESSRKQVFPAVKRVIEELFI